MKIIKKFVGEMLPVIMGVLLALLINNWNENRKDDKYVRSMLKSAKEELAESRDYLQSILPKQRALQDTVNQYLNNQDISIYDILLKAGGMQPPIVRDNAWKAIAKTKIELLEYEEISMWSSLSEGKEIMDSKWDKLFDFIYENLTESETDKKRVFQILLQDLSNSTESAIADITALLEE